MSQTSMSESQHILSLSKELLDDIELSRLTTDKLLLKCSRLARLAGSDEIQTWISFEMQGYSSSDQLSLRYMAITGRWIDREKSLGYWGPLAQQQASIDALQLKLKALVLPSISGDFVNLAINNIMATANATSNAISALSGVQTRVIALLHKFVSGVYYEREFSALAETVFEKYKIKVDAILSISHKEILSKIPSVSNRLFERDIESVSQALSTCRRIIESFADEVYPPSNEILELGGNSLKLDASKHQNRINAYVASKTDSASRRQRLRQNLSNLFNRVSTGVHSEVTPDEALSLFLNVYMFLGEISLLGNEQSSDPA